MNKSDLLNWLQDEYQRWQAFFAQIDLTLMEQEGVAGHWSIKHIVAHLSGWQRRLIARLQAALRGEAEPPPPWPAHLQNDDEINGWFNENNHGRSVREILDEARQVYQEIFSLVKGLPDDIRIERVEPAYYLVWVGDQRFLAGEFFNHFHDDHEPDIRAWFAREGRSRG